MPVARHVCRNITLKRGNVSKNRDVTGCEDVARLTCLYVDITVQVRRTSEFLVFDADISCGRSPTLSCLLQEESKFLLHITVQTYQSLIHPQLSGEQGRLHHRKLGANAPKKFQGGGDLTSNQGGDER